MPAVPAWDDEEQAILQGRWRTGRGRKVLVGNCPNCGHDDAFAAVVVYAQAPDVGNFRMFDLQALGVPVDAYPSVWTVTCKCGDASHADAGGCGKSSSIPTGGPGT